MNTTKPLAPAPIQSIESKVSPETVTEQLVGASNHIIADLAEKVDAARQKFYKQFRKSLLNTRENALPFEISLAKLVADNFQLEYNNHHYLRLPEKVVSAARFTYSVLKKMEVAQGCQFFIGSVPFTDKGFPEKYGPLYDELIRHCNHAMQKWEETTEELQSFFPKEAE